MTSYNSNYQHNNINETKLDFQILKHLRNDLPQRENEAHEEEDDRSESGTSREDEQRRERERGVCQGPSIKAQKLYYYHSSTQKNSKQT